MSVGTGATTCLVTPDFARGLSENQRHGLQAALDAFEQALRLDPTNPEIWNNLAFTYGELDRIEDEVAAYRRAVDLRPDYVDAWHNLTTVYYNRRQFDGVARVCQEAVKQIPRDAHSWYDLGFASEELARLEQAAAAYAEAWALRPDFPGPWVRLGVVYAKLGRVEDAVTVYREVIESKRKARQQFFLARADLQRSEGGQAVLRRLETLYPGLMRARQRKS